VTRHCLFLFLCVFSSSSYVVKESDDVKEAIKGDLKEAIKGDLKEAIKGDVQCR